MNLIIYGEEMQITQKKKKNGREKEEIKPTKHSSKHKNNLRIHFFLIMDNF
jgi:hypothetical protein